MASTFNQARFDAYTKRLHARSKVEIDENWRGFFDESPEIQFPPEWRVKILMPFMSAWVRFMVFKDGRDVSVMLARDELFPERGFTWEIAWSTGADFSEIESYDKDDIPGLLAGIERALNATD
jgi:hypothetical protein